MAKRTSGEGTLYKLNNGRYRAQIVVGGQRLSKTAPTATECREWLRRKRQQLHAGVSLNRANIPLDQYLDEWLTIVQHTRKPSTYDSYERHLRIYVRPHVGHVALCDLKADMLQTVVSSLLSDSSVSQPCVRMAYTALKTALGRAVKLQILGYNPMSGVTLPKNTRTGSSITVWDENQIQSYLIAVDQIRPRCGAALKLAIGTGMRLGEILALRWEDIDFDKQQIHVHATVVVCRHNIASTKSSSSERTIRVGDVIMDALQKQQVRTAAECRIFGWKDDIYCFPSKKKKGTFPESHFSMRTWHNIVSDAAGLPHIRFHDLRHTAISMMLKRNVPITEVSRYAGHSSVSITLNVYGHFLPHWHSQAAATMDEILSPIAVDIS